jgi:hypothetical protein
MALKRMTPIFMGNLSDFGQHCSGIGLRRQIFCWLAANYRFLTPRFPVPGSARRLPVFDASKICEIVGFFRQKIMRQGGVKNR